jgi:hypothetical protein
LVSFIESTSSRRVLCVLASLAMAVTAVADWVNAPASAGSLPFAPPSGIGDWGFAVHEGGVNGFSARPECAPGDRADDRVVDDVVVDPAAGGFFRAELYRTSPSTERVYTRTKVKIAPAEGDGLQDDWYQRIPHGTIAADEVGRIAFIDQAWSFQLAGASDPDVAALRSLPAIGRPTVWEIHTNFASGRQGNIVASCEATIRVWAVGDPRIPAGAVIANNLPHPPEHMSVNVSNLSQQFRTFVYPAGPGFPATCNGRDAASVTDQAPQGEFRLEPVVAKSGPRVVTGDVWVFVGFGGVPQFNWRVRATNLDGGGSDLTQSGQRWRFELPRGAIAQELGQPVTWTMRTHFHLNPDEHDPNGLICESVVTVQ